VVDVVAGVTNVDSTNLADEAIFRKFLVVLRFFFKIFFDPGFGTSRNGCHGVAIFDVVTIVRAPKMISQCRLATRMSDRSASRDHVLQFLETLFLYGSNEFSLRLKSA
jgi:hypothetical protein